MVRTNSSPARYLTVIVLLLTTIGIQAKATLAQTNDTPQLTNMTGELRIGKTIGIEVQNLSSWSLDHDASKLVPYLNGRPLGHVYPESIDLSHNRLLFHLLRTDDSVPAWTSLFRNPVTR